MFTNGKQHCLNHESANFWNYFSTNSDIHHQWTKRGKKWKEMTTANIQHLEWIINLLKHNYLSYLFLLVLFIISLHLSRSQASSTDVTSQEGGHAQQLLIISGSGFLSQQRQSRRRKNGGCSVGQRDPVVAVCGVRQLLPQRHRGGKRQSDRREPPLRSGAVTADEFGFLTALQRLYLGMFFCCSQRRELMLKLKASCGGENTLCGLVSAACQCNISPRLAPVPALLSYSDVFVFYSRKWRLIQGVSVWTLGNLGAVAATWRHRPAEILTWFSLNLGCYAVMIIIIIRTTMSTTSINNSICLW